MPFEIPTALIVIGSIALFFVFLFTVHAHITIEFKDEFALSLRVLGIPIRILPGKPKKYKLKNYTLKKIRKRDAKADKLKAKKDAAKNRILFLMFEFYIIPLEKPAAMWNMISYISAIPFW